MTMNDEDDAGSEGGDNESHKYPLFRQKAHPLARGVYPY
jgi:hypothetical protein